MNKKKKISILGDDPSMMSDAQREAVQKDLEDQRMDTVKKLEELTAALSKKVKGNVLRQRKTGKLGHRPNDTLEN